MSLTESCQSNPRWYPCVETFGSTSPLASLPDRERSRIHRIPRLVPRAVASRPKRLTIGSSGTLRRRIPRKEVIQPQLPLRLPCYDFVPITSPTLDSCPSCELAHRLQVLPAFMT